jgi:short-subunit dehydrogenase
MKPTALIVSITSDIGTALAKRLVSKNWQVYGTYRTQSSQSNELKNSEVDLIELDLADGKSFTKCIEELKQKNINWDWLVFCPGILTPLAKFAQSNFAEWKSSLDVNFSQPLHFLHAALSFRNAANKNSGVLFFAGGGTNNAPESMSAYTIAKIALIKMCELLDAEMPEIKFSILGPGWVKTKIHQAVLDAKENAGIAYDRTVEKFASDDFVPIEQVLDCCEWIFEQPREIVGGRNFSAQYDEFDSEELIDQLKSDPDLYKLRRAGNNLSETKAKIGMRHNL